MPADYTIGLEEEFFVVDAESLDSIVAMPAALIERCEARLGNRVSLELLQSQLETQTAPHSEAGAALEELRRLRRDVAEETAALGLGIIASGTHPFADWQVQRQTGGERSKEVMDELRMLGTRNLLCGLHVHVALPDPDRRVTVMTRLIPFLPLFLALSTSSPFWGGRHTGMLGYRLAAYDELPRTGMPPAFADKAEYDDYVARLTAAGLIPDASYLWWAIRPSKAFPTLELRVADSCTHADDAVAIAVLYRLLVHRLDRDADFAPAVDAVARSIAEESRWRVQRDGLDARIIDPRLGRPAKARRSIERLIRALAPDARLLGHEEDLEGVRVILERGTSAERQTEIFEAARGRGASRLEALKEVTAWLMQTTSEQPAATSPTDLVQ